MNIIATIPAGVDAITVHGLTQWDYGRKLEIRADDLPAEIEVHFACAGMKDAVVRACSVINGVAEAVVPDQCLEQTRPVHAWVFIIDGTEGSTVKSITMPITARTRPQPGKTIPTQTSDKYTELITAVNAQVEALRDGDVTVNRARNADKATSADKANALSPRFNEARADSYDNIGESGLYLVEIGIGEFEPDTVTSLLLIRDETVRCIGTSSSLYYADILTHVWAVYYNGSITVGHEGTIEGLQIRSVAQII